MSAEKEILFRVPADWKQQGTELNFNGPHSSEIRVYLQKIPDGYPFHEYFASVLQSVRDMAGAAETTLTRKTQLQDLEAREIAHALSGYYNKFRNRAPADKGFRFLKSLALLAGEKVDDGLKLLRELANEDFAPAILKLMSMCQS